MKVQILLLLILSLFCRKVLAQDYYDVLSSVQAPSNTGGSVVIHQCDQITKVYNDHLHKVRSGNGIEGWRIRLSSVSTSRTPNAMEIINQEAAKFSKKYPHIKTYREYEAPDFRLYAGDFRTKSEAYKLWQEVKNSFQGAFPVQKTINLPELEPKTDFYKDDGQD